MTAALLVGVLVAGGVYLIMRRELLRVALGFVLLGHAVNILFIAAGGLDWRDPALLGQSTPEDAADPLPQAFVLTAIVITFGITVYLLALMRAQGLRDREERAARSPESPEAPASVAAGSTGAAGATGEGPSDAIPRHYAAEATGAPGGTAEEPSDAIPRHYAAEATGAHAEEPSGAAARHYAAEHGTTRALPPDGGTDPAGAIDQPETSTDDTPGTHDTPDTGGRDTNDGDTGDGPGKDKR